MIIDINEEEREFLYRIVDRAICMALISEGNADLIPKLWSISKDRKKAEILLSKLEKEKKHE